MSQDASSSSGRGTRAVLEGLHRGGELAEHPHRAPLFFRVSRELGRLRFHIRRDRRGRVLDLARVDRRGELEYDARLGLGRQAQDVSLQAHLEVARPRLALAVAGLAREEAPIACASFDLGVRARAVRVLVPRRLAPPLRARPRVRRVGVADEPRQLFQVVLDRCTSNEYATPRLVARRRRRECPPRRRVLDLMSFVDEDPVEN